MKSRRYDFFIACLVMFAIFIYVHNSDSFEHYKNERNFQIVVSKKYKDPERGYFLFVDAHDIIDGIEDRWDISFSNGSVKGLDSLYDYIEIGDTVLKEKNSPILIVKNGARKRVFVGSSRKKD